MEEVVGHLRSMRDNWKEVMKKVAQTEIIQTHRAELPEDSIIQSAMRRPWQEEQEPDRRPECKMGEKA